MNKRIEMKKIALFAAVVVLCAPHISMAIRSRWYGLLTVDKFPISGCVITDLGTFESSNWVDGISPKKLAQFRSDYEDGFANDVRNAGYNAVLGYTTAFLGSGAPFSGGMYLSGVLVMSGTAVKAKCGK